MKLLNPISKDHGENLNYYDRSVIWLMFIYAVLFTVIASWYILEWLIDTRLRNKIIFACSIVGIALFGHSIGLFLQEHAINNENIILLLLIYVFGLVFVFYFILFNIRIYAWFKNKMKDRYIKKDEA